MHSLSGLGQLHRQLQLSYKPSGYGLQIVIKDMTSSNSNDSGIQHDVSVHSSSESLKVIHTHYHVFAHDIHQEMTPEHQTLNFIFDLNNFRNIYNTKM
jgi:hypothetical protein